jgi:CrcB protein
MRHAAHFAAVRPSRSELIAVFAGGCAGALVRAAVAEWIPHRAGAWPWATLLVNLAGAALLGWAVTRLQERMPPTRYWRPLIGTGLCGALTTFSTLQLELVDLVDAGRTGVAAGYGAVSLTAGFAAVWLATGAARR